MIRESLVAAAVLAALPVRAEDDPVLRHRIEQRLADAVHPSDGRVQVEVHGGKAVLDGRVSSLRALQRAEAAAREETPHVESKVALDVPARTDAGIRKDVLDVVRRAPGDNVFDTLEVGVEDGRVLLRGSVRNGWRRRDLEERVAEVPGVRAVNDQIALQSVSMYDERLRAGLFQAIYGSGRFAYLAHVPWRPVRIVVDGGKVTLAGVVGSELDRLEMEVICRDSPAMGVRNQLVVEGEVKAETPRNTTQS